MLTATSQDGPQPSPEQPENAEGAAGGEVWRDAALPFERRVEDLLARLTPAEKIAMVHQHSPAVPRLGLAPFHTGTEALHGAAWLGEATVFPQAVGLGATWHPELVTRVGEVAGVEVRALHARNPAVSLNVWAPVVNPLRDPRWGRNEEGYSEDVLLTSAMAVAYCRGLRGDHPVYARTAPTLKHFLAYNNETDRSETSSVLRPRVLHEYDLPVFRDPIAAGVVDGVMPSYNLVNGRPNHVSPYLNGLLRTWAGRELLVVSDAEAPSNLVDSEHYFDDHVTSHAAALRAGVDSFTDHSEDSSYTIDRLTRALERGLVTEADIDRAVRRVLTVRFRTGEFDPGLDPYAAIGADALDRPEHRELARQTAREQVVLLKNADGVLPLTARQGLRVAVVGPFAASLCADWYSGTMPYRVTVADGLRAAVEAGGGTVVAAEGVDRVALLATGLGRFVSVADPDAPALTCALGVRESGEAEQFDVFDWGDGVSTLRSVASGRYVTVKDDGRGLVADQTQPNGWDVHETFNLVRQEDGTLVLRNVCTGTYVAVDSGSGALSATATRIEDAERFARRLVHSGVEQAYRAMHDVDAVVVVVGNDPHINGRETQDRTTIALPPSQEQLVRAVATVQPRTVLLVMSGYPYALPWADRHVPAIVWTSHAGQETGHAVADVLLGGYAPTGRLPQTWHRSDSDLPGLLEYDIVKARRTYQYFEGSALYPFGHGLTYTTFGYGGARVEQGTETVAVTVDVANTGGRAGVEVVQVYTRAVDGGPDRPVRRLQAFARVALEPGESRAVTVEFPLSGLELWDVAAGGYRVEPGAYDVLVGRSCTAVRATARLDVPGEPAGPRRVTGADVAAADFDDYADVTLVDATRESGDAVAGPGWVLFRDADLSGASRATASVSGGGALELRADAPDGPLLATLGIPPTDRYEWTTVGAEITPPGGVRDLYLVLAGEARVVTFRLD